MILFDLFPNGKKKAVTFSYDDGSRNDLRLIETLEKYGAKTTLNLVSDRIEASDNFLTKNDVLEISKSHEIANHTKSHDRNDRIPFDQIISEIIDAKYYLEDIIGKPVMGFAYPYGSYNKDLLSILKNLGVSYARTSGQSNGFSHPQDFLTWEGTCHHDNAIDSAKSFINIKPNNKLPIFYIWGHSHDFERKDNWHVLTETLDILKDDDRIWYATNIELYEYITAIKNLRISHGETSVYNPSCVSVFATINEVATELKPGLTILK